MSFTSKWNEQSDDIFFTAYPEFQALIKKLEAEGGGMRDPNMKVKFVPARTNVAIKNKQEESDSESSSGSF